MTSHPSVSDHQALARRSLINFLHCARSNSTALHTKRKISFEELLHEVLQADAVDEDLLHHGPAAPGLPADAAAAAEEEEESDEDEESGGAGEDALKFCVPDKFVKVDKPDVLPVVIDGLFILQHWTLCWEFGSVVLHRPKATKFNYSVVWTGGECDAALKLENYHVSGDAVASDWMFLKKEARRVGT
jgi:hypothetical protein